MCMATFSYKTFTSRLSRPYLIIGVGGILLAGVGLFVFRDTAPDADIIAPAITTYSVVRATEVPLAIEGVLIPRDNSVIGAQTSGRLGSVPAKEGSTVARGDVLAVIGQPVLASEREVLLARIEATRAQRALAEASSEGAFIVARESARSDEVTTEQGVVVAQSELGASYDALLVALESAYSASIEALDFLGDTSSVTNKEVQELQRSAVRMLAGTDGLQYMGGPILPTGSAEGVLGEIARLRSENPETSEGEVRALADRVIEGVDMTAGAYDVAEKVVYERGSATSEADRLQYNTYRASMRSTQSQVKSARGALMQAYEQYRLAQLTATETMNVRSVEVLRAEQVQSGEVGVSDSTLQELYAQLRTLETSLGEAVVRAPYAGVVTEVLVSEGTYVTQGTPLVRMHTLGGYEVEIIIAPQYIRAGLVGAEARFADGTLGVVDRIAPQVKEGVGGVAVFVVLESAHTAHVSGMRIRGELMIPVDGETNPVFMIPHNRVSFEWSGPVVRTKEGVFEFSIVRDTDKWMYGTSNGLEEGMELVW
jgi:multidrug efflux pump subunit AcrA (membrane-fusion protein)